MWGKWEYRVCFGGVDVGLFFNTQTVALLSSEYASKSQTLAT